MATVYPEHQVTGSRLSDPALGLGDFTPTPPMPMSLSGLLLGSEL